MTDKLIKTASAFAVNLDNGAAYAATVTLFDFTLTVTVTKEARVAHYQCSKVLVDFSQSTLERMAREMIKRHSGEKDHVNLHFLVDEAA